MNLLSNFRDAPRYLRDPVVPWQRKIWVFLILLYFLSPIDFLPDIIPGLGWLDDLVVLAIGLSWFSRELKRYREQENTRAAGAARTIDAEYEVCPEEETGEGNAKPGL